MTRVASALAAAALLTVPLGTTVAFASPQAGDVERPEAYLVVLRQAPVAAYQGGIGGYQRTAPTPGHRFESASPAATAYRAFISGRQDTLLARAGNPVELYSYTTALNGFAAMLTAEQVKTLSTAHDVLLVQPDTVSRIEGMPSGRSGRPSAQPTSAAFDTTKAAALWRQVGGPEDAGRGVVVGVIDTGVWPENPSLAGIPISATTLASSYPGFSGRCQAGSHWSVTTCNSKVLAAQYFVRGFGSANVGQSDYLSARDGAGHGTSVASVAVGNAGIDTRIGGQDFGSISGVAPAAGLSVYKACWSSPNPARDGCDLADTVKAVDQAVADGVDIINYSIGDAAPSLASPIQLAFLNAAVANVFVATAAGNAGPAAGTVQHPAPWVTTVGANTDDLFQGGVRLGDGQVFVGAMLSDRAVPSSPLVLASDVPASGVSAHRAGLCYPGTLDAQRVDEAIVVCDRGVTSRVSKSAAVAQAGGRAMVLVNTLPGTLDADLHRVPTVHLGVPAGEHVTSYLARAGASATAEILPELTNGPVVPSVPDFSGRGPSEAVGGDVLKPDLTAPGVSVITAVAPTADVNQLWDVESGTSVAAPHVAGTAAVVRSAHPTWTPATITSAMTTTATPLLGVSPFSGGAGEIDDLAVLRPGLVYDAGVADWSRVLREHGVDLWGYGSRDTSESEKEVNAASIAVGDLVGRQTVTRTVTNTGDTTGTYTSSLAGLHGLVTSVSPDTLRLAPGQSADFTVTFAATNQARYDEFATGSLTWQATDGTAVTIAVVVRPELASVPAEVTGSGSTGSATLAGVGGVTGTLHLASPGLVGVAPVRLQLTPGSFDPARPAPSSATARQQLTVAPDSRAARIQVSTTNPGDDVDLHVYRGTTLVASSTGRSSDEIITLSRPAPGTYEVYVTAHHAGGSATDATYTAWVLPHAPQDNLAIERRYVTVDGGEPFAATLRWAGLDPALRWWGYVAVRGLPGATSLTVN